MSRQLKRSLLRNNVEALLCVVHQVLCVIIVRWAPIFANHYLFRVIIMHGAPLFTLQLSFVGHQLTLDVNNQSLGTRYCIEGYYSLLGTNFRGLLLFAGH